MRTLKSAKQDFPQTEWQPSHLNIIIFLLLMPNQSRQWHCLSKGKQRNVFVKNEILTRFFQKLFCIIHHIQAIEYYFIYMFHNTLSLFINLLICQNMEMYLLSYLIMKSHTPTILIIFCLLALSSAFSKYRVVIVEATLSTVTLGLKYTGTEDYYLKPSSPIIKQLMFTLHVHSPTDFYFKITDAKNKRFEVPQDGIFPSDPMKNLSYPLNSSLIQFEYTANPFDFKITQKLPSQIILFSTYDGEIIFSDKYLEITTRIASPYIYGLGQRVQEMYRVFYGKWTIFNRDRQQVVDRGQGLQTYGYYPFYMLKYLTKQVKNNSAHLNYFRSSNAMDIIRVQANSTQLITYKVIGGIFDFRFILSETMDLLIQQFLLFLGRSQIPPFWSLGFHQSRRGYSDVAALEKVIQGYEQNGLPLDGIWSDIDYMINYEDFTIDETRFPLDRMAAITAKYHYIPVIGGGIRVNGTAHTEGKKRDVFIKDADGSELHGKSWAGKVAFVDFFHPNATKYWADMLDSLYSKVKFSGIWLTNNEYSNFCDGPCQPPSGPSKFDYSKDLPYNPGSDSIQSKTIPLNSTHYGNRTEADVHVFNGFLQTYATHSFLKGKNMRPFVLSRSTTLGSNRYGFHWTGDNYASYQSMGLSIIEIITNRLWGIHIIGTNICGFDGGTSIQLCCRWLQIGALYPFARIHNNFDTISQQPYALGETVLLAAKTNLKVRYSLLKHYYSLLILEKGYGSIIKSYSTVFFFDIFIFLLALDKDQFMIGQNIMAAPLLYQPKNSTLGVYFSTVNWFDLYTGKFYPPNTDPLHSTNIIVKLTDRVPLFIIQGTMVLTQNTDNVRSTKDLNNIFTLTAAFIKNQTTSNSTHQYYRSVGTHISLKDYNDDAKVDACIASSCEYIFSLLVSSTPQNQTLTLDIAYVGPSHLNEGIQIDEIKLYNQNWIVNEKLDLSIVVNGTKRIIVPIDLNLSYKNQGKINKKVQQQ